MIPSKRGVHENRPEIGFSDFGLRWILTESVGPTRCESKVCLAHTQLANCRCYLKPESSLSVVQFNTRRTRVFAKNWPSASMAEAVSTHRQELIVNTSALIIRYRDLLVLLGIRLPSFRMVMSPVVGSAPAFTA